jgi:hypothetical protein
MKLAKHLFEKYRWTIDGTNVPTDNRGSDPKNVNFSKEKLLIYLALVKPALPGQFVLYVSS